MFTNTHKQHHSTHTHILNLERNVWVVYSSRYKRFRQIHFNRSLFLQWTREGHVSGDVTVMC